VGLSWFETALTRLLTMRFYDYFSVIPSEAKQSILSLRREMDCFAGARNDGVRQPFLTRVLVVAPNIGI
jgi:hypothetical protein